MVSNLDCWSDSLFKSAFLHVTLEHRAVSFSAVVTGSVCPNIQTAPYPAFAYFSLPSERPKGEKAPGENDPVQKTCRNQLGSGSLDFFKTMQQLPQGTWWLSLCCSSNAQVHTVTWADDSLAITDFLMASSPMRGLLQNNDLCHRNPRPPSLSFLLLHLANSLPLTCFFLLLSQQEQSALHRFLRRQADVAFLCPTHSFLWLPQGRKIKFLCLFQAAYPGNNLIKWIIMTNCLFCCDNSTNILRAITTLILK